MTKEARTELSKLDLQLWRKLDERAKSVGFKQLRHFLRALHDDDRTLEFDRAILATFVVWVPIVGLLFALAETAQGRDILADYEAGYYSRWFLFVILVVLDVVATVFSSNLIAAWFFPRIARAGEDGGLYWPRIPADLEPLDIEERGEARAWIILPAMISIAAPISILFSSVFDQTGWLSKTLLGLAWFVPFALITLLSVFAAVRFTLRTICLARPLMFLGLWGLIALGFLAVWATSEIGTPAIVVSATICWLLTLHGFTFLFFLSRYVATRARLFAPTHRRSRLRTALFVAIPRLLKRHLVFTLFAGSLALYFWLMPVLQVWMSVDDGRLDSEISSETKAPAQPASPEKTFAEFTKNLPIDNSRRTIVLVTAAGGGIRAAYWTGAVLSALQDNQPTFKDHVFAISAVSGGALGAATYKALTLRDQQKCKNGSSNRQCTAAFLGGDFVGPNIVSAITGEVIQAFARGWLPVPTRDQTLQLGWSFRWSEISGTLAPSFSGDFDALFVGHPTPALLLNGTSIVTGRRTVTSNLDVAPPVANGDVEGKACTSEAGVLNPAQHLKLSVSAAVLTSARFPYVTPPGLLRLVPVKTEPAKPVQDTSTANTIPTKPSPPCRTWDEIVDGGYVDNEGVITMRDMLNRLIAQTPATGQKTSSQLFADSYRVVVIRLSTQPAPPDPALSHDPPPRDQLNQLVVAFTNQQTASGRDLVREFRKQVTDLRGCWIEFNALYDDAPLGWSLSTKSRNRLDTWLDGPTSPAWAKLYPDSKEAAYLRVLDLAREVDLKDRLRLVRDLVNGKDDPCVLKDRFN